MLGFLIENIYVVFGDQVFQQCVGIPMGTNCAPLLADLFLYSYEAEFVQKLLRDKNKRLAVSFNHTYRYIDDVLSINNHNFHNYVHMIYPEELEIKDTQTAELQLLYMTNVMTLTLQSSIFIFVFSNIPLLPAYGVYIFQ